MTSTLQQACDELSRRDARLAHVVRAVGTPRLGRMPSTFSTIARSIAYQQLSGKAASTIWGRFLALFPDRKPVPESVLRKRETTLRGAGLSNAKVAAVRDLARHVVDGRVKPGSLWRLSDEDVVETLTQVRGIGEWSAQMHLMFSLGRLDVWPVGDLGVRKGVGALTGIDGVPDVETTQAFGDDYRPWRSLLAWYCWRVLELDD